MSGPLSKKALPQQPCSYSVTCLDSTSQQSLSAPQVTERVQDEQAAGIVRKGKKPMKVSAPNPELPYPRSTWFSSMVTGYLTLAGYLSTVPLHAAMAFQTASTLLTGSELAIPQGHQVCLATGLLSFTGACTEIMAPSPERPASAASIGSTDPTVPLVSPLPVGMNAFVRFRSIQVYCHIRVCVGWHRQRKGGPHQNRKHDIHHFLLHVLRSLVPRKHSAVVSHPINANLVPKTINVSPRPTPGGKAEVHGS